MLCTFFYSKVIIWIFHWNSLLSINSINKLSIVNCLVFLVVGTQIIENGLSFFTIKTIQLFLSLFTFVFYGSVLISFVTVSVPKPPFSDLEGVLQNGRYNILAIAGKGRVIFEVRFLPDLGLLTFNPLGLQGLKPYRRLYHSLPLTAIPSWTLPIPDPQGCGVLMHIVDPPHPWPALGPSPPGLCRSLSPPAPAPRFLPIPFLNLWLN